MPELPEVETIRMQLEKVIVGLRIEDIEALREKSFVGDLARLRQDFGEVKVIGVRRRAKVMFIELENGVSLAIHLKMTGQLIFRSTTSITGTTSTTGKMDSGQARMTVKNNIYDTREMPNKYTRVVISFSNGAKLFFNDLRVFGWVRVVGGFGGVGGDEEKYGPEAVDEETFSLEYFQKMLSKTNRAVKLVILDQEKLAGVGNIYANEALFRAGIDPTKKASILGYNDTKILREEIIKVLLEAIEHGGTSDKDEAYRQIDGSKGGYQKYLQVYNREGLPCGKCGELIKKIKIGGRGTYYCEKCQT